jgi:cyclase
MSAKISRALKKISRRGKLRYILNTHWHGDHTGGNSKLGKNATIIAHKNVRKRLMKKQKNFFGKSPVQPKSAWPVITFDYSLTVHFNGETIKMSHYPHGHTDGDGVVYFKKSNVLHMGDHFFNGIFPFVDLNSGGNVLSYARNVGAIIRKMPRNVIIIPGHGALSNLKELKVFHRMLIGTIQHVRKRMLAGKSLRTMQKEGLPKKWKSWGKGFIKEKVWIRFIQTSIIRKATMRKHMKPYHRHRK